MKREEGKKSIRSAILDRLFRLWLFSFSHCVQCFITLTNFERKKKEYSAEQNSILRMSTQKVIALAH